MLKAVNLARAQSTVSTFPANANSRPSILVDDNANSVADPQNFILSSNIQPLGRGRMLWALPFNGGPALLQAAEVMGAGGPSAVLAQNATAFGWEPIWVSRLLTAVPTENTREMGGGGST